ncbi:zinc-ribbon domain-containing protein [Kineosporia sp. J2-2]|uniref:Zinc-ribbon domain-containing protein n=1 Tax=Kineosporia corallincola TaxID=2835133 RepID=A0ABS5TLB0_9ACTN|nr:zinc ribbon domain-containing protein [Kineosporia corallincola]MBT0771890.1 zinc-ribbon domain-containing protein [Kineosporia corallincola]
MTERRGRGARPSPSVMEPQVKGARATRRGTGTRLLAVLTLTLALLPAAWFSQAPRAGAAVAAVAPHPARPVTDIPDHEHGGSTSDPSPSTGGSDGSGGTEHDADSHVDLPESGQRWTTPDLVAQGALVRIETVADVYVALHHYHVEKYSYTDVSDPQAVASGAFVNSRGLVITGKGALHDDEEQEERFGTWGVNQAFVQAKFLKELPDDPFGRTTITSKNKGELADSPPTDPEINDRLQSCYDWETSHHCAVFVVMHQRVMPSVQNSDSGTLEGLPQSDSRVAVLSTQPRGIAPLTLQLANPEPGAKYWVVSSRGVNEEPLVGTGTLTDDESAPISDDDLAKWSEEFGVLAEGAPVVSDRGDLVAFLGTAEGSDELAAVSASHMSNDLRTFGLTRDSSPVDAQFQDGLELFEASQFAAAVPKLKAAAEATGGQRVARELLGQAEDRSGTAEDLSDEADALTGTDSEQDGWSPLAIGIFAALIVLVLIGAVVAVAVTRRRSWPNDDASPAVGPQPGEANSTGPAPASSPPASSGGGPGPAGADSAEPVPAATPHGHGGRPTTLFATGTTDPKVPAAVRGPRPASDLDPQHTPDDDPGEAPTMKRAATPGSRPGAEARATPSTPEASPGPDPTAPTVSRPTMPGPTPLSETPAPPRTPALYNMPAPSSASAPSIPSIPSSASAAPGVSAAPGASAAPSTSTATSGASSMSGASTTSGSSAPAAPSRPSGSFCRQCGAQLSPGDRFCFSCGTPSGPTGSRG